jgi:hypothetical protein
MNNDPLGPTLTPLQYYQVIRGRIEHEDNLVMQRLSWMVASQSFLFTAYAIVLNGLNSLPTAGEPPQFLDQQILMFHLVPVVAILTCVLIYISILAALKSMANLRRLYRSRFGEENEDLPDIQPATSIRTAGSSAPTVLPLVFTAVWLFLWVRGLI